MSLLAVEGAARVRKGGKLLGVGRLRPHGRPARAVEEHWSRGKTDVMEVMLPGADGWRVTSRTDSGTGTSVLPWRITPRSAEAERGEYPALLESLGAGSGKAERDAADADAWLRRTSGK